MTGKIAPVVKAIFQQHTPLGKEEYLGIRGYLPRRPLMKIAKMAEMRRFKRPSNWFCGSHAVCIVEAAYLPYKSCREDWYFDHFSMSFVDIRHTRKLA
jgi:hypothetical protein